MDDGTGGEGRRRRTRRAEVVFSIGGGLVALLGAVLLLQVTPDLWWGVTHAWTVQAFGESFRLPVGWREVSTPEEQQTLELRSAASRLLGASDEISIREAQDGFDAVDMAQRWERQETRLMIPGDRLEPTPKDAFLREHYRCSDIKRSRDGRVRLACFDREGRWVVTLRGRETGIKDLSAILQSVSPTGMGR